MVLQWLAGFLVFLAVLTALSFWGKHKVAMNTRCPW